MRKRNILIIGCNGGMGRAVVKRFSSEEFNIFGLDIQKESFYKNVHYFKCDIRDEEAIKKAYSVFSKNINELYAIISVAGIYNMDSLLEISDEDFKRIIDINVLGIQRVIKVFFPLLKKDSRVFITTSELATYDPLPFNGIYSISKSFLEKFAFSLRMEVNNFGIKVITYRPGAVQTNLLNDSTRAMENFVEKTVIHKEQSKKFKHIVESVESKSISAEKNANKIYKIINKKRPKYSYSYNRNFGLILLNLLPAKLQVAIISKILK